MPDARPLRPGDPEQLGDYEIVGLAGEGSQATVYLGRSPAGGSVAVKLLRVLPSNDPVTRTLFTRAFDQAKQAQSQGVASLLDVGLDGERPYIVSEFVDGPSLQRLVDQDGPRGPNALERIAVGTATALTALHLAGVVHHAFKPGNVLLAVDGPRVVDFGIAQALEKVGAAGPAMAGNPAFMAPEQLSGVGVGPAADVFAWGGTMVFAATGRLPFGDDSGPAVMQRIMYEEPDLTELPPSLRGIVAEALAKDPGRRPSARQILDRLLGLDDLVSAMPDAMVTEAKTLAAEPVPHPAPVGPVTFEDHNSTAIQDLLPPVWEPDTPRPAAGGGGGRKNNRALGVIASVGIGVLAGVVLIALVLWPQLDDSPATPSPSPSTAAGNAPVDSVPQAFAGTWSGTAINAQRGNASFPVQVTFQPGQATAAVVYPRNRCRGTLTFKRGTEQRLEMDLQISRGCTSGSVVVTRQQDGSLQYAWKRPGTALTYQATLTRG
ncbi:serine/threonine protein kinase [Actinomadura craniellae]|nr:serine/threonine-protein kinase [Actinomadura craniellae]